MTTSQQQSTASYHQAEMYFDIEDRRDSGWVFQQYPKIQQQVKNWNDLSSDIIIKNQVAELDFSDVFVGYHEEDDFIFETQFRDQKLDDSHVKEIDEETDKHDLIPETYPMVVVSVSDWTNGYLDFITVNGKKYQYVLIVGNHRYMSWIKRWESAPFTIGKFVDEFSMRRFARIESNQRTYIESKHYNLNDFKTHIQEAYDADRILKDNWDALFDYVSKYGSSIRKDLNITFKELTDRVAKDHSIRIPQWTWTKETMLEELMVMNRLKFPFILGFLNKVGGSLDDHNRRWYVCSAAHTGLYGKKGLAVEMTEMIATANYTPCEHIVVLGFQKVVKSEILRQDMAKYKQQIEYNITTYLKDTIWKGGAKALGKTTTNSSPQAGSITFAWMATEQGQDINKLYDAEGFELSI